MNIDEDDYGDEEELWIFYFSKAKTFIARNFKSDGGYNVR